ncbi:MAG: methionyl-tRNA formyltransferase, partial [Planctomycetaceae bacterium]|nr:methionyl-tRNA formyltransferase [Planctomycetaceae bacterium]
MRIIGLGTGAFAVPSLKRLMTSRHEITAVITMPQREIHHKKSAAAPVREWAGLHELLVLEPEDINDPAFLTHLNGLAADLLFVCDYGKILAKSVIGAAKFGGINLHGSLLPKYRGAAPINHALLNGEPVVGVSVIHITPELDAGPIVAQSPPLAVRETDTAVEIEAKLAEIGAGLVLEVADSLEHGTLKPVEQPEQLVSKAPKLKKSDGLVDWNRSAREIFWQYQALQPWPKIFTTLVRKNHPVPLNLILGAVRVCPEVSVALSAGPGEVLTAEKGTLIVAAGRGAVRISALQPAGKKMMEAASFLRGYPVQPGDLFGGTP